MKAVKVRLDPDDLDNIIKDDLVELYLCFKGDKSLFLSKGELKNHSNDLKAIKRVAKIYGATSDDFKT